MPSTGTTVPGQRLPHATPLSLTPSTCTVSFHTANLRLLNLQGLKSNMWLLFCWQCHKCLQWGLQDQCKESHTALLSLTPSISMVSSPSMIFQHASS